MTEGLKNELIAERDRLIDHINLINKLLTGLEGDCMVLIDGVSIQQLDKALQECFKTNIETLKKKGRKAEFVRYRVYCYRVLRLSGMTLEEISEEFDRTHATVIHNLNVWHKSMENNKHFKHEYGIFIDTINELNGKQTRTERI